jgi:phage terminase large subunit-like protein
MNVEGHTTVIKGYGAKTGVRGAKEQGTRPQLAVLDDLVSDEDARSPTVIASIEDTVYKAIDYALHPTHNKIIWSGTPFNARDPLYKAVESGAWAVNVYPICEEFPVSREDFRGCWEDRFTYDYVLKQYTKARLAGKIDTFNQELMLRIMSEEDRLIKDSDIVWYKRDKVLSNKGAYNFYITTDFATSEESHADFSVISVWAYNNNGDWLYVDGICVKQLMDKNIDDLFRLVQEYNPQEVGIEISGQQKGFIPWIQGEMSNRNIYFTLASDKGSNQLGLSPNTKKITRFNVVVPLFKLHKIWFPEELKLEITMIEAIGELSLVTKHEFKSKYDDFADTISMLAMMTAWKPSQVTPKMAADDKIWDEWAPLNNVSARDGYLV